MSVQNQPGPWQSWEPLRVSVKQLAGVEEDTMCATVPSPWSPTARRRRSTFPHQQFPRVLLLRHRRPEEERVVGVKKKKKMAGREYLNHKKKKKKSKKEGGRLSSVSSTWFTWVHIKDENFSSSQYTFQCVLTFICRKPLCVDFQLRLFEVDRSWAGSLFAHKCCDANLVSGRLFSKWNLSFNQTVLKEQSTELTLQVYNTVLIRCRLARWAIPAVQPLSASFEEAWRTVFRLNSANAIQLPLKLCAPSFFIPPHL